MSHALHAGVAGLVTDWSLIGKILSIVHLSPMSTSRDSSLRKWVPSQLQDRIVSLVLANH